MNKSLGIFIVYIIIITPFLTNFQTEKFEATENLIYIDNNNMDYSVNTAISNDYWISYNDGYADTTFGLTGWGIITMTIELTDTELAPYRHYIIDKLRVAFGSDIDPPGEIVDYEVWIERILPSNPYCGCHDIIASGTSTGDVWNIIDIDDTAIPNTGNLFIGINIEQSSDQYPCGVDQNQAGPTRAALMTYHGLGSWTDLFTYGFPGVWCLDVGIYPNSPPNTPSYLNPPNHEKNVDINDNLQWICSDPEGDSLTYDVYFGTVSNLKLVSIDQHLTFYDPPGAMDYNTKYYWEIVAKDEFGASSTGPIWDFTTLDNPNNPPFIPSHPNPENGSINITTNIVLNWIGGDPDVNDTVTYDVYFGSIPPFEKIASNISNTSIDPGLLTNGLTYFWNIVSWDNHGLSTNSPSWHFTTINPNNPPNKPNKPIGEISGKIEQNYTYITNTTDPDGDQIYYKWDWGDGTYSTWDGPYDSNLLVNASNNWDKGTYNIRVKAKDIYNLESNWSEPLIIRIEEKSKSDTSFVLNFFKRFIMLFPFMEKLINQII